MRVTPIQAPAHAVLTPWLAPSAVCSLAPCLSGSVHCLAPWIASLLPCMACLAASPASLARSLALRGGALPTFPVFWLSRNVGFTENCNALPRLPYALRSALHCFPHVMPCAPRCLSQVPLLFRSMILHSGGPSTQGSWSARVARVARSFAGSLRRWATRSVPASLARHGGKLSGGSCLGKLE